MIFIQFEPVKCHQQLNCLKSWRLYICGLLLIWKSAVCHISNNLHMSKDFKLVFQPNWTLLVSSTAYLSDRLYLISTLYICGLLLIWMSVDCHINCTSQQISDFQACFKTNLNPLSVIDSWPAFNVIIRHLWSIIDVKVSWLHTKVKWFKISIIKCLWCQPSPALPWGRFKMVQDIIIQPLHIFPTNKWKNLHPKL